MEISVRSNQTVLDIAIQHSGSIESVTDICRSNGISLNEALVPGLSIDIPKVLMRDVTNYYVSNPVPGTAVTLTNISFSSGFSNGFN